MKAAIIFVLGCAILGLAIATVAKPPIQDQPTQTASHGNDSIDKKSNLPDATFNAKQGIPFQVPASKESNESNQEAGTKTDWWARITNALIAIGTLALAVIGGIGARYVLRSLRAIEGQTGVLQESISVARTSATAAKNSADALVASERAWIDGDIVGNLNVFPTFEIRIENHGKTPAQLLTCHIHSLENGMIGWQFEQPNCGQIYNFATLIACGQPKIIIKEIYLEIVFDDWLKVSCGEKDGTIHIILKYRDLIDEEQIHETHVFCIYNTKIKTFERLSQLSRYT